MNNPIERLRMQMPDINGRVQINIPKEYTSLDYLLESMQNKVKYLLDNTLSFIDMEYLVKVFELDYESIKLHFKDIHKNHIIKVIHPNIKNYESNSSDHLYLETYKMLIWLLTVFPHKVTYLTKYDSYIYTSIKEIKSNYINNEYKEDFNEDIFYSGYDRYASVIINRKHGMDENKIVDEFDKYIRECSLYKFKRFKDVTITNDNKGYLSYLCIEFEYVINNIERNLLQLEGKTSIYSFAVLEVLRYYLNSNDKVDFNQGSYSLSG